MTRCVHGERTPRRCCGPPGSYSFSWLRGCDLYHPRCLLFARQATVRGELIDQVRQMLTKASEQIIHTHAGLFAQRIERVAAERVREIIWRDIVVRTIADPRLRDVAMPALL